MCVCVTDDGSCTEGVCVCVCVLHMSRTCLGAHRESGTENTPEKFFSSHTAGIELLILYFHVDSESSDLTVHVLYSHLASSVFTQLVVICRPPPLFVHFGFRNSAGEHQAGED